MLARYRIVRGARPANEPLPEGIRQDTRKHTAHVVRPTATLVEQLLADPSVDNFAAFRASYLTLLEHRFEHERDRFEELARLARDRDVYFGCNCPSARQPDVRRCHTALALEFFARHYPDLTVRLERPLDADPQAGPGVRGLKAGGLLSPVCRGHEPSRKA
jgi:hypothetical protein